MSHNQEYILPHNRPELVDGLQDWHGFVGADNIEALFKRIKTIVVPGRAFNISRQDIEGLTHPPRVNQGCVLLHGPNVIRKEPISLVRGKYGSYVSASMHPGSLTGFGFGVERQLGGVDEEPYIPTAQQVRDFAMEDRTIGTHTWRMRFEWSWVSIDRDHITIIKQNESNYREMIDVVPCDIRWENRFERDAITADQFIAALEDSNTKPSIGVDVWHPAHGVNPEEAEIATRVLRQMAVNIRHSREALVSPEVYPEVDYR